MTIQEQTDWLRTQLNGCFDVVYHTFVAGPNVPCALVYLRGMVDLQTIQDDVLHALQALPQSDATLFYSQLFDRKQLPISEYEAIPLEDGVTAILQSHVLLLVDGEQRVIDLPLASYEKRSVSEPPNESAVRGPREAFIENAQVNLSLVRRRLKTPEFKSEAMIIGTKTQTNVYMLYLQGVSKQSLVDEVRRRLTSIEIDGLLGSSVVEEFFDDSPFSPFPQIQYTERPDVVAGSLLEGRVAVIVDGTPIVLLAPVTLFSLLQSSEDYYQRYVAATWIRWIRYLFILISLLLPSTYIAVTTFHPEMIPTKLLITIAASREVVPFPALIEAFIMEISFEALREAAVRIPKPIGQAVSIIGALIIGTAAVQAGIVSAAMVIIVALTGIASFIIPHFDLGLSLRLLRFPIMVLAGMFGLFGITCGMLLIYIHLVNLRSFDTPYLNPVTPLVFGDLKDTLIRAPWWLMRSRPSAYANDRKRLQRNERPWVHMQEENQD
ncbi:spore germination protein [Brevibacillus fluminis]|uniref:Spore germination protein n=1 Tax=Brevibacillus fluminis TaxID=511487 RepID=A0A3M8DG35_9BACL|nr:spore germination protein [Brevibacillus fluminis]RNB87062.1 spore germination protein [Brevibacillus fluminis]